MSLFQPSLVVPDIRSGLGLGVVDASSGMTVSWKINGQSALVGYSITIYANDAASTQKYTTGKITAGCPAYGVNSAGEIQFFSYSISASTLSANGITNGNEYKLAIKQWWGASDADSVEQSSASVFITRAAPTLAIDTIGTAGTIDTRYYTFSATYSQTQGDVLNYFRWQIAYADDTDEPFFDTGNVSGTMDVSCYYDGFFTDSDYCIRLTAQTESGVDLDTGWEEFSCQYDTIDVTGGVTAGCVGGTDAVLVNWNGIGYIPGDASGPYSISADNILTLPVGSSITWDTTGASPMSFSEPWGVIWKGSLSNKNAAIFTIGQSGGDIALSYDYSTFTLSLKKGSATLGSQSGIINSPEITVILAEDKLYIRTSYMGGGLYPGTALYPGAAIYPDEDDTAMTDVYELSVTYTQVAVTSFTIGPYQMCEFFELTDGSPSAETITAAITDGTYTPYLAESDYMMCDFSNGLNAGTLDVGGDTIQGFALYRRQSINGEMVKVAETDVLTDKVYDYGARSQQGPYTYYLFPIGTNTYISTSLVSGTVMPGWWNWTLMECAETDDSSIFTVLAAWRFRLSVETGAVSNNNAPNILQNFTRYPTVQLAPQNYKSGTLSGLIGAVDWSDGAPEYIDTIAWRDGIYALSTTQNPLFLKNRKGDLIRVRISAATTMQTVDATREQQQLMSLAWVEVGDADGVSLYSTVYRGVQTKEGEYKPQYYVDTADATADDAELRIYKTAYGESGKLVGDAKAQVVKRELIMPAGMEVS